jgi:hypothetical protein
LGGGTPPWEDSLRRRIGAGKRAGRGTVFGGIPDRLKTRTPKTGVLFPNRQVWSIPPEICQPDTTKQVHFKPSKMPYFVNKTPILAYFKNNVVHLHAFAGRAHQVISEQALFAKLSLNWGDLITNRMDISASFL